MQGAGGVGGLLAVTVAGGDDPGHYVAAYDANGNITEYVDATGAIVAHREYSPFGETTALSGLMQNAFTHWWSTKPWDPVTGLSEYQFRMYSPELGRWLSRDPIEEEGGQNLYAIAGNNVIVRTDYLGLFGPMHPGRAGWLSEFEKKCRSCSWNAMQNALKRYPFTSGEPKMGHVNCMRHCLGSADVASKCGRACAFAAGHGYELKGGKYFSSDSRIDRRNNRKGRACADAADREECCKRVCPPCESTY
jgi:RHS repeat-associated protein